MRTNGASRATVATAALAALLALLSACGGEHPGHPGGKGGGGKGGKGEKGAAGGAALSGPHEGDRTTADRPLARTRAIPGIGNHLQRRIPANSRQVVAVYGAGKDAADATAVLFVKHGSTWQRTRTWPAHNGKKGWTADHHEGDLRSPVGVFTLSDAGGVLADPGARLPYTRDASFAAPRSWAKSHWHDFDYVIAIDYNRVKGTPPDDPTRPQGDADGGGIWLHMDHGSGTSACVSVSKPAMEYLLRTLDPDLHPVVVMGDRAALKGG